MSNIYKIECTSGAEVATLEVRDVLFPLSDSWSGEGGAAIWGEPSTGGVEWFSDFLFLIAGGATAGHQLFGFKKATVAGETGDGMKYASGGSFPDGDFSWKCISVV